MRNLLWAEEHIGHNISPSERRSVRDVTTVITTRYWVDSVHEIVDRPGEKYFSHRAELFAKYTLPSMTAQVRPPDYWLILVSPWVVELPEFDVVADELKRVEFARLVVVPEGRAFSSISRAWITEHAPKRTWLASARLDNDDAISRDFVSALSQWVSLVKPVCPATVSFPVGLQLDDRTGESHLDLSPVNHFTAAISHRPSEEKIADPYLAQHTEIYRGQLTVGRIYQAPTRWPMWIEVLHDENAANHDRPGAPMPIDWTRFSPSTHHLDPVEVIE